jgi:transposase
MREALVGGEQDPVALADLARGRLRAKLPQLRQAWEGRVRPVHLVQLRLLLDHSAFLAGALAELQQESEARRGPFAEAVARAQTIPGVAQTAVIALVAEIGTDLSRFPSAKHLASWAGVCPGNKQRGGKRLSGQTTPGNGWLRAVLGEVAWAISHPAGTYRSAQFHRRARRRGKQKAVLAVAHSVLVILSHLLRDHRPYTDRGADDFAHLDRAHLDRAHLDRAHLERRSVHQLERLGSAVTLTPSAA